MKHLKEGISPSCQLVYSKKTLLSHLFLVSTTPPVLSAAGKIDAEAPADQRAFLLFSGWGRSIGMCSDQHHVR